MNCRARAFSGGLRQALGFGVSSVAMPVGLHYAYPTAGAIWLGAEAILIPLLVCTAIFGTKEKSERAFRLFQLVGNRPESTVTKAPPPQQKPSIGDGKTADEPDTATVIGTCSVLTVAANIQHRPSQTHLEPRS